MLVRGLAFADDAAGAITLLSALAERIVARLRTAESLDGTIQEEQTWEAAEALAAIRAAIRVGPIGAERSAYWLMHRWDDAAAPVDSVETRMRPFLFANPVNLQSAAFDGLSDADRLGLIQNDTLRSAIVEYYENRQPYAEHFLREFVSERRLFWHAVAPYVLRPPPRDDDTGWPLAGPVRLMVPWNELRRSYEVANAVSELWAVATIARRQFENLRRRNDALREAIRTELANR